MPEGKFPLGKLVATPGALKALGDGADLETMLKAYETIGKLVHRHWTGDWGELTDEDRYENECSLREGFRLLSAYTVDEVKVWVITEADRSVTTVLLPEEY